MTPKKYQIFVSSTHADLSQIRRGLMEVIQRMNHFPVGMEQFSADDDEQWEIIRETILQTDYYICIIGHRYGSLTSDGRSFTEKEWDYAAELGVPIMTFIRERNVATTPDERDSDPNRLSRLEKFIVKAKASKMVDFWSDADDLYTKAVTALHKAFGRKPRPGWIRAESERVAEQLAVLVDENRSLRGQVEQLTSEVKHTSPAFGVLLNGDASLLLKFVPDEHLHLVSAPDLSPLVWNQVPEELKQLVSREDIEKYNAALPGAEEMERRVADARRIGRVLHTAKRLVVEIKNTGSARARELYFDLQFPAEAVLVLDEDDLKKWKIPELGLPNNPIEKAQQQLALHRRGRQPIGQYGILPKSFLSVPPVDFSRLSIKRSLRVDGNKLTIWLEDLMHTRRTTFDEAFIVPLQLGSFEAHGTLISEELASPQNFVFPISVTPGTAGDARSTLMERLKS